MSSRAELVERWQTQLVASENLADSGPDRLRWLWKMRVRLYRFLILCYGSGEWNADASAHEEANRSRLIDNRSDHTGLSPKSAARIRATLKQVHNANDQTPPAGPFANGLWQQDWIRVALFRHHNKDARVAGEFCDDLKVAEVEYRVVHEGRRYAIEVQRLNFDIARDLLRACRERFLMVAPDESLVHNLAPASRDWEDQYHSLVAGRQMARKVACLALFLIFGNFVLFAILASVNSDSSTLTAEVKSISSILIVVVSLATFLLIPAVVMRIVYARHDPRMVTRSDGGTSASYYSDPNSSSHEETMAVGNDEIRE